MSFMGRISICYGSTGILEKNDYLQENWQPKKAFHTPTVFGLLLGYPVVYVLNADEKTAFIESVDLELYEIIINETRVLSFSLPLVRDAVLEKHLAEWIDRVKEKIAENHSVSINLKISTVNLSNVNI
ncbi:unnamed protein product [Oikopleura dioica]|uniref:Uncharacterized protein n=1 Tax=Oikopleura dioica TaxID=34765 RepID=E4YQA1_OIKDI|nr:unnamed protein product [Oikopleura dioica]